MNAMEQLSALFFLAWAFFFGCLFIIGASLFITMLILWDKYQEKHWRKPLHYSSDRRYALEER